MKSNFNIGDIFTQMKGLNNNLIIKDGDKSMIGTGIPYISSITSDVIINDSTVSISEYQKMVKTQPVIQNTLMTINNLVKNQLDHFEHSKPEYEKFINNMIERMHTPWEKILDNALSALWAGFSIGEKKIDSMGRYQYIVDIEPRPAQSILFRVDSQGNVKDDGIIQYYFNNLWNGYANLLSANAFIPGMGNTPNPLASLGDLDFPWRTPLAQPIGTVIIPKQKCLHWAYSGLTALKNPYGVSLLRAAYDSYLARADLTKITLNAAKFSGSPTPIFMVDPQAPKLENGQTAYDNIYETLVNFRGGDAQFLLFQAREEALKYLAMESNINLGELIQVNEYFDRMLLTSMLFASELVGLSDKGSYALGKTQKDLVGRNINAIAKSLNNALVHQFVEPVLRSNFNEQNDFGAFAEKENVAEDIASNQDVLNTLRNLGIILNPAKVMEMVGLRYSDIEKFIDLVDPAAPNNPGGGNHGVNANYQHARTLS